MNKPDGNRRNNSKRPARPGSSSGSSRAPLPKRAQKPKPKPDASNPDAKSTSKSGSKPFAKPFVKSAPKPKVKSDSDEIRLNKYIGNSGVCSRREADLYIESGAVKVNGVPVTELGYKVKPGDVVNFDGQTLTPEKKVYVLLNKPKNFSTSSDNEGDMRNVNELVRAATPYQIKPVGRMDKTTTGLLLFTNDNDIINKFAASNQKSFKIYQVSLDKNLKFEDLEKITGGVTLDDHRLYVDEVSYIEEQPKTEIGIKLRTANVKVVRAIFEAFQYNVLRVDRVAFAGLTKKNLPRGNWRFLTEQEVINLKNG